MKTPDEIKIQKMRDCFYAGYTIADYCKELNYKYPLLISYSDSFLWELRTQFTYSKHKIVPDFRLINEESTVNYTVASTMNAMHIKKLDENIDFDKYDVVLIFTTNRLNVPLNKAVYFDNLLNQFINKTYAERPIRHYINTHPGTRIIVSNAPNINKKDMSELEKWMIGNSAHTIKGRIIQNRTEMPIKTSLDHLGYTNKEVLEMLSMPPAHTDERGCTHFTQQNEENNKLLQIKDGKRKTIEPQGQYKNTIYCMGTCTYVGYGAPWDRTFESYLQTILNNNHLPYKVENESQYYAGRYQDIFYNLHHIDAKPGDIVLICIQDLQVEDVPFFDTSSIFNRPHQYGEVFLDEHHINEQGYKILAEHFFNYLKENNYLLEGDVHQPTYNISTPPCYGIPGWSVNNQNNQKTEELKTFLEKIKKEFETTIGPIGSIVMNCNPFTKGHRYLVETASKNVSHLFIFVVEENKSEFSFEDRIELVRKGTADLKNVTVLPSGSFIISSLTFSEYFNKSALQDIKIDPTEDVEYFAKEIAPVMHITKRFVGEEPLDKVTKQYNECMKTILPKYGIELIEIPRVVQKDEVISASRVRKLLKEGKIEDIKELVPDTTLQYLIENYKKVE